MIVRSRIWTACLLAVAVAFALCGCRATGSDPLPYSETFDEPRSSWGEEETGAFERGHEDGVYAITLRRENWFIWAHPGQTFGDVRIDADVLAGAGAEGGIAGILCRHRDPDNFYFFAITSDGYYAIFRRVEGGALEAMSGGGALAFSEAIRQGNASNHLQVLCQADELSLSVNGQALASVMDASHTQGDVGVGAGSGPFRHVRAEFDNFEVTSP